MVTQKIEKGYKHTELGAIPVDWSVKKIGDALEIKGSSPITYQQFEKMRDERSDGTASFVMAVKVSDMNLPKNETYFHNSNLTKLVRMKDIEKKTIPKNAIIFPKRGAAISTNKKRISSTMTILDPNLMSLVKKTDNIDMRYFYYWFQTFDLKNITSPGPTPQLNKKDVFPVLFPLPSDVREQESIVRVLSDTDALIESLDTLIEKKKNIKQGAMQELLTGKKRLNGDLIVKKNRKVTDIGIIPEDWDVKTFDELFKFLPTGTNARSDLSEQGDVGYIHYGDIHAKWRLFLDCDTESIPFISIKKIRNLPFVEEGDLVIADASEDYSGIGTSVELKNVRDKKIVCGLHTIFLRGKKNKIADGYKAYLTSIPVVKNALISKATGISVYGLSKNTIKNTRVPLPVDLKEQTSIAQVLSDMESEIEELEQKRDKYRELKVGMMHQLLTGRIRLKWKS